MIVKILNSVVSHVYYSISESEMPGMGGASGAGSGSGKGSASISKYQINMVLNMGTILNYLSRFITECIYNSFLNFRMVMCQAIINKFNIKLDYDYSIVDSLTAPRKHGTFCQASFPCNNVIKNKFRQERRQLLACFYIFMDVCFFVFIYIYSQMSLVLTLF